MLKDSFFTVKRSVDMDQGKIWRITLNGQHPIYQAHFAGNPVMPGACIAQMIKELAEDYVDMPLRIMTVKNMKFLKVINPLETNEVTVQISCSEKDEHFSVAAVIDDDDVVFSKATLILTSASPPTDEEPVLSPTDEEPVLSPPSEEPVLPHPTEDLDMPEENEIAVEEPVLPPPTEDLDTSEEIEIAVEEPELPPPTEDLDVPEDIEISVDEPVLSPPEDLEIPEDNEIAVEEPELPQPTEDLNTSEEIEIVNDEPLCQKQMDALGLCVVLPTYNNGKTLAYVLEDILQYTSSVIVINDGSTDDTEDILNDLSDRIQYASYYPNRGKGNALKKGFDIAEKLGYKGAITLDSDGQHFASEIMRFIEYAEQYPEALLIGQRIAEGPFPPKNSFANKFSNFWFTVQTAHRLKDTQNGFRLYPLAVMKGLRPVSSRYEAELEMLVRLAWRDLRIVPVPTRVYYPSEEERVTHFRPCKDFLRISLLNTLLTLMAIVYGYPSMLIHRLLGKKKK